MGKKKNKDFDALKLKRKLSKQFSDTYTNEKGLIDRDKLKKDLEEFKKLLREDRESDSGTSH